MRPEPSAPEAPPAAFRVHRARITLRTRKRLQFIDLTPRIAESVARSGVADGLVQVQTRHTTTGIVINENEPLLLRDLERMLERWVPDEDAYDHDDLRIRRVNLVPGERANGPAHARAMLLGASETIGLAGGLLLLGRWQRVFLVELDGPRVRTVCVGVLGLPGAPVASRPRIAS